MQPTKKKAFALNFGDPYGYRLNKGKLEVNITGDSDAPIVTAKMRDKAEGGYANKDFATGLTETIVEHLEAAMTEHDEMWLEGLFAVLERLQENKDARFAPKTEGE